MDSLTNIKNKNKNETEVGASLNVVAALTAEGEKEEDMSQAIAGTSTRKEVDRKEKERSPLFRSSRELESDTETETEQRVYATRKSGRRGKSASSRHIGSVYHAQAELRERIEEDKEVAFDQALRDRAFRKSTLPRDSGHVDDTSSSEKAVPLNPRLLHTEELRASAERSTMKIFEVAKKSGNLKGTFVKALKDSAAALHEIIDTLAMRTETEEIRRLTVDNNRLRNEVELLKEDVRAHRREFTELRTAAAAKEATGQRSAAFGKDVVEDLKAFIISSVGTMINARLENIEGRLLPEKSHRPPLSGGKRKELVSAPRPRKEVERTMPMAPMPSEDVVEVMDLSQTESLPTQASPSEMSGIQTEDSWAKVTRLGKRTIASSAHKIVAAAASAPKAAGSKQKRKLVPPQTAAVIVTLQPQAVESGVTYAQILERAEEKVNLGQLGIEDGVKVRRAATGARILELSKDQSPDKAEKLAEQLRAVLDGVASVIRPTMMAEIRITGLDDSVTKEKVMAAVTKNGICSPDTVKMGEVHQGPGGMGMVLVRCPIATANALSEAGRILVGWSSARVTLLEQRPLRCYKCMGLGHTKALCTSSVDRSTVCYRCGKEGHKSWECKGNLKCAICSDAGKPSGHIMGSRECKPPISREIKDQGARLGKRSGNQAREENDNMSA